MRILITGVCGFAGSTLARGFAEAGAQYQLVGCDNFIRPGSEGNRAELKRLGVVLYHADLRAPSDVDELPRCDWVIDAAANPSVLAGVDGQASTRQLVEHNLGGTINLLEYAKRHRAGLILLSTSRVYSIPQLASIALHESDGGFQPTGAGPGWSAAGLTEEFSTQAPISPYGATKLASEILALEYGEAFMLPVFINRCGVLAGAGQFGRPDQGIFAYWINQWKERRPLRYLGFGGGGHQVRDCLHPHDLLPLLEKQISGPKLSAADRVINVGGGVASSRSLRQLSDWCAARYGPHPVIADGTPRPFDLPWIVLDPRKAERLWSWRPQRATDDILSEIAAHAERHPDWLDRSAPF